MTTIGHNEAAFRLDLLRGDAKSIAEQIVSNENRGIDLWIELGRILNEGRALFPDKENDRAFGEWVRGISPNLGDIHDEERAAAMWAAANSDQFAEARAAGKARTVRGIHAKWKEIEAEREKAAKAEADAQASNEAAEKARLEAEQNTANIGGSKADQEGTAPAPQENIAEAATSPDFSPPQSRADQEAKGAVSPDPHRTGLSQLSRDGLEEEVAGLRAENAELREKLAMVEVERDRFKAANKDLSSSDQGATISRIQKQLQAAKYARDEAMSATKREEYKRKKAEKELARIMGQEIEL